MTPALPDVRREAEGLKDTRGDLTQALAQTLIRHGLVDESHLWAAVGEE
jgi:hypothetical protein